MGAQVVGPLGETFVVQQEHEEKGPEHTDGVGGRSPAWARGIERAEQRPGWVQIEPQEHQGGLVPRLRQATGWPTEPALKLLGQGLALLGMREDQRGFLLGRKGKQRATYGPIVPRSRASGQAPRDVLKSAPCSSKTTCTTSIVCRNPVPSNGESFLKSLSRENIR
jgi:hypothetical protein